MSGHARTFELPKQLDRYMAALSKLYEHQGKRQLQEIVVNARTRVHEEWSYDNWNGGTYGHAIFLELQEPLFLAAVGQKDEAQQQIKDDLNKLSHIQSEFIQEVFLELGADSKPEWRRESGLLLVAPSVSTTATKRIWGDSGYRLFLSHKSEVKKEASTLKDKLKLFGVSCFVAHQDIQPTKAWQEEIENALATMDGFAALMTANYHDSDWTDQEVGFAFARGVPIVGVRMGRDPYGFLGKFQGLASAWPTAAEDIVSVLIRHDRMFSCYIHALRNCPSWDDGNKLGKILRSLTDLETSQINQLLAAYNETEELRGSFAFNGRVNAHGPGLLSYLNRLGAHQFRYTVDGLIEQIP